MSNYKTKTGDKFEDANKIENTLAFQEIINILRGGTCIFLGAGISKLAGYPLWEELKGQIVDDFYRHYQLLSFIKKESLLHMYNPIDVMDFLYSQDKKNFEKSLKRHLNKKIKHCNCVIFNKLKFLKYYPNFFITTNIDNSLEQTLQFQPPEIHINPNFGIPQKGHLYYIHGHIKHADSWVFTRQRYTDIYLNEKSKLMDFLVQVFSNNNVIFLGYSLRDFEILQAISKSRIGGSKRKHFLIEGFSDYDAYLWDTHSKIMELNYGIERIGYSMNIKGYYAIYDILDEIEREMTRGQIQRQTMGRGDANPS